MKIKIRSKKIKDKFIYGDLLENKKAQSIVIFLSGFSGSGDSTLFKKSSKFFFKNGFSTIRFNVCNDNESRKQKDAIKPEEITLSIYREELKSIIDVFGKKYSRIILIGHSFGAVVSILFLAKYKKYRKSTELILWEPTLLPWKKKWMQEDFYFDKKKKLYLAKHSNEVMNRTFYNECINIKNTALVFKLLNKRICILAGTNIGKKNAKEYFSKIRNKGDSKILMMSGGGHSFEGENHRNKLFNETVRFLG
ncbi:MAG: alpha/beta fold hydrolase [Patescibacteria group bacterium]